MPGKDCLQVWWQHDHTVRQGQFRAPDSFTATIHNLVYLIVTGPVSVKINPLYKAV